MPFPLFHQQSFFLSSLPVANVVFHGDLAFPPTGTRLLSQDYMDKVSSSWRFLVTTRVPSSSLRRITSPSRTHSPVLSVAPPPTSSLPTVLHLLSGVDKFSPVAERTIVVDGKRVWRIAFAELPTLHIKINAKMFVSDTIQRSSFMQGCDSIIELLEAVPSGKRPKSPNLGRSSPHKKL